MRKRIFSWLAREFISLSSEARATGSVAEQTDDLFRRFEEALRESNLSLDHTVRTRLWGSDAEARELATGARSKILTGKRKAASSSYISASHFDSGARVALDLLAMRPSVAATDRVAVEFEPARLYISQLRYDSVAFVSGFTSERDRLEDQVTEIFADIDGALKAASTTWNRVAKVSVYISRTQKLDVLKNLLQKANRLELGKIEFEFVDGFAREKALLEIEATALMGGQL
jgi:enamine deaminase RidA (YjgF/YER057c/UK114 family)